MKTHQFFSFVGVVSTCQKGDVDLEKRLEKTRLELEQSRAECGRLAQIRDDVEAEVRELTASLFQVRAVRKRLAIVPFSPF